jgi:crotonobetainyl-CoA:carnitine CoA-transferase CaiB-like acyl-CoA transferase
LTGPLDGIKIVDLTSMISGPVATMLLADQGAEVIKVEPKNGDIVRHVGFGDKGLTGTFLTVNRGKKSINLDLKSESGKEVLKKIIITADCFIQNFRPGAIERMGFGEEEVRKIKEDIVYVSISGFGEEGPYSKKRVYDPVIQALSGLASIQADRETGRPRMVRTIIPDKVTALTAAQAITAALLAKERKGIGQHVRLSMLDSMINFLWPEGLVHLTFNGGEKFSPDKKLSQDLVYETKDNYITVGAVADSEWEGLCMSLDK